MTGRRAALLALAAALAGPASAAAAAPPATPIRHFVVLMQENHSFDNYFGTYPGADGIPAGTCMPLRPSRRAGPCVRPFRLGNLAGPDVPHDAVTHREQAAGGRMNGFISAVSQGRQRPETGVMGHYDGRDLPFYWNVAGEYVLFDRWFASSRGGSVPNRLAWVAGSPGARSTIFDRLERRGISWKFYVEDYDPGRRIGADGLPDTSAQAVRVPVLNMSRFVDRRRLVRHVVDLDQYYEDLRRGTLPQVAYIAPAGSSEHPPRRPEGGQTLVRSLLTSLARSRAWPHSAFVWTYDEWGGWYDHVRPPAGRGFRVPALLVSPYARHGFVDSTVLEHASIPRFIEHNWGLRPLSRRDARAHDLTSAFDFGQPPRAAEILPATRAADRDPGPRRLVIYLWYAAALLLAVGLIHHAGRRRAAAAPLSALAVALALGAGPAPAHAAGPVQVPAVIQTNPPTPGMRFSVDGVVFAADASGQARPPASAVGTSHGVRALATRLEPGVRARFERWYGGGTVAALDLDHEVTLRFVDLAGRRVDPGVVDSVTLLGSNGERRTFQGATRGWLQGNRVVPESGGRRSTLVSYAAERVVVAGASVVHRAQQRFFPARTPEVRVRLLLFAARFEVHDALLGFPIGSAVRLRFPDGRVQHHALGSGGEVTVNSLPRGDYRVSADALGISSSRPVALSGDQRVEVRVVSWLDIIVVLLVIASIALALLYARRPARVRSAACVLAALAVAAAAAPPPAARAAQRPDPLFAYYYIWFNGTSWDRAKTDYPVLGRYSSDDRGVMRQHMAWAKRAGIDGFIVSWKSTPVLNRRLERLADVAASEHFKLLVIYQGLDFYREPLPASRVARDLDWFRTHLARRSAFGAFRKPAVIWSGTWRFSRRDVAAVTRPRRADLLILASERNVAGYRRLADVVDGDAYYWASVNPRTYPDQAGKLRELGKAVHDTGGIWIPSAAPGFDARLVGGTSVVGRRGGATLRDELDAAASSNPDALGLISWNEFSENTHVEPSVRNGSRYLHVVADARHARLPQSGEFDSSEPAATGVNYGIPLLGAMALFLIAALGLIIRPRVTLRR